MDDMEEKIWKRREAKKHETRWRKRKVEEDGKMMAENESLIAKEREREKKKRREGEQINEIGHCDTC